MAHVDPIIDKIIVARVGLLLRHPFFGNMATRLKIQEGWPELTTAATDGRSIFFSRKFFDDVAETSPAMMTATPIDATRMPTPALRRVPARCAVSRMLAANRGSSA